ncbi:hypothetical protein K7I13_12060 [Brucepastera parasyntrophica]|uniref:hypothetical protein n=1 Tax=Brucepastera parasyntrophica TaxID=2880008 RepID=UPI00210C6266|nr:hypothetical protein [Brucepastera parasyntrophica]ULQ59221.1 hypothetical protein K7I13_12060 [Brucepastera parasyntrophica]
MKKIDLLNGEFKDWENGRPGRFERYFNTDSKDEVIQEFYYDNEERALCCACVDCEILIPEHMLQNLKSVLDELLEEKQQKE